MPSAGQSEQVLAWQAQEEWLANAALPQQEVQCVQKVWLTLQLQKRPAHTAGTGRDAGHCC